MHSVAQKSHLVYISPVGGGNNSIYTDDASKTLSKKQLGNDIVSSGARAENIHHTPIPCRPFSATSPAANQHNIHFAHRDHRISMLPQVTTKAPACTHFTYFHSVHMHPHADTSA